MEELLAEEEAASRLRDRPAPTLEKKQEEEEELRRAAPLPQATSRARRHQQPCPRPPAPTAAPMKPAASAAERAEAALRAAIADGGLSALEVALAAVPREVYGRAV
jgi:hypothetical protein